MNMVDRVRGILVDPRNEWVKIAAEPATVQTLYTGWIMIFAAIGPIALLLAGHPIQFAIAQYVLSLIITFVLALIVDALTPSFGGTKDFIASLKLTAYSYTIGWLAGIFALLGMLGSVLSLLASIYAFYTFYLGVPVLKKAAPEKAVPFTLVIVLCAIVLGLLSGLVFSGMMMTPRATPGMGLLMR
jgi:Yip1-like protein